MGIFKRILRNRDVKRIFKKAIVKLYAYTKSHPLIQNAFG